MTRIVLFTTFALSALALGGCASGSHARVSMAYAVTGETDVTVGDKPQDRAHAQPAPLRLEPNKTIYPKRVVRTFER
jgi:hypothetical protein